MVVKQIKNGVTATLLEQRPADNMLPISNKTFEAVEKENTESYEEMRNAVATGIERIRKVVITLANDETEERDRNGRKTDERNQDNNRTTKRERNDNGGNNGKTCSI